MYELEIKGKIYPFRFGIGFLKKINDKYKETVALGVSIPSGFKYLACQLVEDHDITALADILLAANSTERPRIGEQELYDYLESADIDRICDEVTDFLSDATACKKQMQTVKKALETQKKYEEMKNRK